MGKRGQQKKKKRKSNKTRTPLSGHKQVGKELLPPFAQFGNKLSYSSWMNERLPEMAWAALIRISAGQDHALAYFRRFLNFIGHHARRDELSDVIAGIEALIRTTSRKFQDNDMFDLFHCAAAIPYCQAFFCDRAFKQMATHPKLRYDRDYAVTILSEPDEILACLSAQ